MQQDDVDPLDAFMDAAVNPEVAAAEKAEAARKEELRKQQVKALAVSAAARLCRTTTCIWAQQLELPR